MAVHIRLTRVGATRRPAYRVIAIDSRRSRDGRALEILGYYNPLTDPITLKLDDERITFWMSHGARPSDAVQRLMKVATEGPRPAGAKDEARAQARSAKKAAAKAQAEQAAAEAPKPAPEPVVDAVAEPAADAGAASEEAAADVTSEPEV
ncbi:MAG TPA: 30S ribosomal protein S16, partial [Candidatus Limnocylindria bacterium]|nr:30S ribosomal protein S16 [Candidatus Limnocylindria bacterium]